ELLISLDSISTLVLECVCADLVDDPDTAALLLLIHDRTTALLRDHSHGLMELRSAVAFYRRKDITRHALRVDTNKCRHVTVHRAHVDSDELLIAGLRAIAGDLEFTVLRRQIGRGNVLDRD